MRVCAVESEDNTYSIGCVFLRGSEARGCIYTLVGAAEIDRMGGVGGTIEIGDCKEVRVKLRPSSQVLAYDWERNGSFGTLPVTRSIEACSTGTTAAIAIGQSAATLGHPSLISSYCRCTCYHFYCDVHDGC